MHKWIISIDPSASFNVNGTFKEQSGFAVFRDGGLIQHGEIQPSPPYFDRERLWLRNKIRTIFSQDENADVSTAVESVYLGPNPSVFKGLIEVKAHLCSVARDMGVKYCEVNPLESFQSSTGFKAYRGKGTRKNDIRAAVLARYCLPEDTSEHEIDAISVGEAILKRKS